VEIFQEQMDMGDIEQALETVSLLKETYFQDDKVLEKVAKSSLFKV